MRWTKETALFHTRNQSDEVWRRHLGEGHVQAFDMEIRLGKRTDMLQLKKEIVENLESKVSEYQKSRGDLFRTPNMIEVEQCCVCGSEHTYSDGVEIYGANYVQCSNCSHVYLASRPDDTAISEFYKNDDGYSATYTDRKSADIRVKNIAEPWLEWTLAQYKNTYGKYPKKVLDIGAGAGHFLEACRRKGIDASGCELSDSSRAFSKEVWGIEIDGRDFLKYHEDYHGYDLITFWGLLEHTPDPSEFIEVARQIISSKGMIVSKIPRWDCLGAAAQICGNEAIIRHLDPVGHIMMFTDGSAAELHAKHGFKPTSAWYYGMDVYELLFQTGYLTREYKGLIQEKEFQMNLQQWVDEGRFSDQLVLACVV